MNYASPQEILDFCNIVREAGGANPLDALMPAVPTKAASCLIARNLNFSCHVGAAPEGHESARDIEREDFPWAMFCDDEDVLKRVGARIRRRVYETPPDEASQGTYYILLPRRIGRAANAFDEALSYRTADGLDLIPYIEHTVTLRRRLTKLRNLKDSSFAAEYRDAEEERALDAAIQALDAEVKRRKDA